MNSNCVKEFIQDNTVTWTRDFNTLELKYMDTGLRLKTLTWTMTTMGYVYYTWNLYVSLKPFRKLMIVCCDKESYTFFRREGIPCILWNEKSFGTKSIASFSISERNSGMLGSKSVASFGSEQFKVFNHMKLDILKWIDSIWMEAGFEKSLYLDGDIVCKRDPWGKINELLNGTPLLFQCDCHTTDEHIGTLCNAPCSGVIAHDHTKQVFQELYSFEKELWKTSLEQDQVYIQNRLKMLKIPYTTLPRNLYGNGKIQMSELWKNEEWVLLHYNFRIGLSKKIAMKKDGNWLIPY